MTTQTTQRIFGDSFSPTTAELVNALALQALQRAPQGQALTEAQAQQIAAEVLRQVQAQAQAPAIGPAPVLQPHVVVAPRRRGQRLGLRWGYFWLLGIIALVLFGLAQQSIVTITPEQPRLNATAARPASDNAAPAQPAIQPTALSVAEQHPDETFCLVESNDPCAPVQPGEHSRPAAPRSTPVQADNSAMPGEQPKHNELLVKNDLPAKPTSPAETEGSRPAADPPSAQPAVLVVEASKPAESSVASTEGSKPAPSRRK
jgi:hypothetical protein